MSTVTLQDAESGLTDLIQRLHPGEECLIVEAGKPLASLKKLEPAGTACKAGSAKGKIHMAPDFDEPLEEFREYME